MKPTWTAAVASSLLLLAGCGATGSEGDVAVEPGADSAGVTDLTVRVKSGPGKGERTFRLTCDPPGGDHPRAAEACRLLDDLEDPFAPVPRDAMCTEIYGGPQTARVRGTFRGEPVDARFSRTNGCEIARWDKHLALLVERGGAF